MARARGRCTASRSAARVPHIVEPGRDGGAGPPTPRAERASPCARLRSGAPCRGAGASPSRLAAESSHKILRGDEPLTTLGPLTHGATMRERVKRIFRNVNDGLDLILFMNAVDPHIDMSFFYATGITDGLFEGCGAWLAPDGGLKITTSALEEEAAKKSGLPLEVFRTIVGSGPNGAEPHYSAGPRKIERGDMIVIDFGAQYHMYCSDITRTVVIGPPSAEQKRMHETVAKAQAAALAKMKPGARGSSVDAAARTLIDRTKYKGRFIHGLGHSVGLAVHDPGTGLSPGSDLVLRPNMVLTDEPGIYVPGF